MSNRIRWVLIYTAVICFILLAAQWGSQAVTTIAESTPIIRKHRIILDPGHGGEDGGAISFSGRAESTYNLEIALRLRDLLHFMGYDTKMTRTEDISIYTRGETLAQKKASDLKERLRIVAQTENPVFLSIHQNNFIDPQYSGAQIFYAQTTHSKELAEKLQTALADALNPGNHRTCKKITGVYLMEHLPCTGVLIECGFLSNPAEEAKLRDGTYQKRLCCVIATSTAQFLSNT